MLLTRRVPWRAAPLDSARLAAAFLVLFPFARHNGHELAAVLLGANLGPVLLVTGSLSGLLWLTVARNQGLAVGPRAYFGIGLVAGVPALIAATIVLTFTAAHF